MKKEDKITAEEIEKRKIAYKIVESNLSHKAGTNTLSIEEAVNAVVSGMEHVSLLPVQEQSKQEVKMLTYSEVEELADEHLKIASISKHEGHCEQWIEGFYNFYESLLSLPLKEEQKRLTDKDLLNLMGRFYFQLEKAKGDEVQQVYKVYATQFRSLLGEQRKEGKDEV